MKKALIVASVASMIDQFNMNNISILIDMGYEVHVACNFVDAGTISAQRSQELKEKFVSLGVTCYQIDFERTPKKIGQIYTAFCQLNEVFKVNHYEIVHCHSPIGGMIARIVAKKCRVHGTKVIYTAHGFHFYKGAPLKNWLLYYPVEWFCAHWTDVLITINKEDFALAQKHMHAKRVEYVPGVGIDVDKFANTIVDRAAKRREIGVPEDAFLLLSVGELNENKNHQIVIKALAEIGDSNIHYAIAGRGELYGFLLHLAKELNIADKVHLLGYRSDVAELYKIADTYILPSIREGLNVSIMEALTSGLPVVCSSIRGNVDMIENGYNGFLTTGSVTSIRDAVLKSENNQCCVQMLSQNDRTEVKKFDCKKINEEMKILYYGDN